MNLDYLLHLPDETKWAIGAIVVLALFMHTRYNEHTVTQGPTILTTLGIFATFVGIARGLADFNVQDIQKSVPSLLGGLKTAFWASVVGVGGALTLKLRHFIFGVRTEGLGSGADGEVTAADLAKQLLQIQVALVGKEEGTVLSQLKLSRSDTNDRLDALKRSQDEAMIKLSEMGSKALVEALRDVIRDFNSKITEQFGDNFKALNEAVHKTVQWQDQYRIHIEKATTELNEISDAMKVAANAFSDMVLKSDSFSRTATELGTMLSALAAQKEALAKLISDLGQLLSSVSTSIPTVEAHVLEIARQLSAGAKQHSDAIGLSIMAASQEINNALKSSSKQNEAFLQDQQKELGRALAENVQLIRNSIQSVGQDYGNITQEFGKQIADMTSKTKEQVTALDAALTEELTKSLESLGRQLAALSEKFVSDYGPLTDRLRQVVTMAKAI